MPKLLTNQEVIKDFEKVHGDKYDYSKVIYKGAKTPVNIICKKHKTFPQTPSDHKNGRGCPDCYLESKFIDLTKNRYGKLTVIRAANKEENKKFHSKYWLVKCACGRDPFLTSGRSLLYPKKYKNTNYRSFLEACKVCTDRRKGLELRKKTLNKLNKKTFGLLEVIRDWGTNKGHQVKVLCKCECGKQIITRAPELLNGTTQSCGCLGKGWDSYIKFKEDLNHANGNCHFYIADLDDLYIKIGITCNLAERKRREKYRSYIFTPPIITRAEAWTIEQTILYESKNLAPQETPKKYLIMNGQFEIRERKGQPIYFYQNRYQELLEELAFKGWEDVYLSRFNI